jgi:protein-S-isoprenylcysteine O-methyltransferase Ste14
MILRKILYGTLFMVVLPCLLILWAVAAQRNVWLHSYGSPLLGYPIATGGLGLMFTAMWQLWRQGGGLPMNAFPPPRLVSRGAFQWLPHPIYVGFVAVCLGVSMAAGCAAGLWLVTPCMLLASTALVLGHERLDLKRRFGDAVHLLPADDASPPSTSDRIRFLLAVIVPWLALYEFTVHIGVPGTAFRLGLEDHLPIYPWTILIYASSYVTVALAPWCARTRRDLRRLTISAWAATAVVFPFYWIVPSSAPRHPLTDHTWAAYWLAAERSAYPPTAAFPSFHVLWAVFVGRLYRPRWLGVAYVAAVAVSCITTGMHYIPDVVAALLIAPLLLQPRRVWRQLLRITEWIANSWREWRFGSVRIINHGFYAGAAAFVQIMIVTAALDPGQEWKAFVTGFAGLLGAGAWAQWVEGSSRLRRPFGFYGGLIGVGVACLFFDERLTLLAAYCLGAPWMQAIGRLRCLANGCCHGAPASVGIGIRVTHRRSRVTRLASLAGLPIHPTQLYSILSNTFLGLLLFRLWFASCPASLICGVYAFGNGVSRFVEEAYRGEPQTSIVWGLRLYQWIAVVSAISGALLTTLPWPAAPALALSGRGVLWALAFASISIAAMGADFPEIKRPLACLT